MHILSYPDPVLRQKAKPVEAFDAALRDFVGQMIRAMNEAGGLGLAAEQVGAGQRVAIVSPDGEPGHETVLVNPEITASDGWEEAEEGCLSFPGIYVRLGRFLRVRVAYRDLDGQTRELEAEGLLARAVQHELDHLDGRLLVDRMNAVQRMSHRRRLKELERRFEERGDRAASGAAAL
jgi:peptide deformylase